MSHLRHWAVRDAPSRHLQAKRVIDFDGEGDALVIDFNVVLR